MPKRAKVSSYDHIRPIDDCFIGREQQCKYIRDCVGDGDRLIFLQGTPKTGKDAFARHVCRGIVKMYEDDVQNGGELLHAYSIQLYLVGKVLLKQVLTETIRAALGQDFEDLDTFLRSSDATHLFLLQNCDKLSENRDSRTSFLDTLAELLDSHTNVIFVITSRVSFRLTRPTTLNYNMLPLSTADAKNLLQRNIKSKATVGDGTLTKIVQGVWCLPHYLIQIGVSLREEDYTPDEMVEILERSPVSVTSDESYSDSDRHVCLTMSGVNKLNTFLTEEFTLCSHKLQEDQPFPVEQVAETMNTGTGRAKQDFLHPLVNSGNVARDGADFIASPGSYDFMRSMFGVEKFTDKEITNDTIAGGIVRDLREVANNATRSTESCIELSKYDPELREMRDNLLKAIAAKQLDEKYRSYKLASNIAKTILTNFVRPRKCYEEYFERCENLIHTHLDPYGYVDEKSPKKEPIQSDEYEADLADATECVSLGKHVAVVHPSRATHETPLLQNKEIQTNQEMSNQLNDGSARMRNQATRGRTTSYEETGEPKKHHPCDPNIADLLVKNNDVAESLAGQEGMKQRIVLSINHHRSIDAEQQNQSDIREQQLIVNADVKGIECMAQGLSENVTGQPLHPSVELSKSKVNERQIFPSPAHSGNADDSEIPTPAAKVGPTLNRSEKQSNSHTAKLPIHTSTTPAMASGSLKRNPASPSNTNVKHHDFIKGCEDDNGE